MKLIVGLGNPGSKFIGTRHNVGYEVLDKLLANDEIIKKAILMKPHTYMNESGLAIADKVSYFKIKPEDIWVICDDLDLPVGEIRVRKSGSSGGHRGLQSIIDSLETDQIPRIKIGIGREKNTPAENYVLGKFTIPQRQKISLAVDKAAQLIIKFTRKRGLEEITISDEELENKLNKKKSSQSKDLI